jgi:glycosyltransferase involved in cell wall biosynthesis
MNVLWISNTVFPAPSKALGLPEPVVGGWMYGLASQLKTSPGIKLAVAAIYSGPEIKTLDIDAIRYYLLPAKLIPGYQKTLEPLWQRVCDDFKPDVVHIHGTEFAHGLACLRARPDLTYVVSIQGLVSVCARYYMGGIGCGEVLRNITLRDILRRDTLFRARNKFQKRGLVESEYFREIHHFIGRTSWDHAHAMAMSPGVSYHFCNESLRDAFYDASKWNIAAKRDRTIFLSQAYYPLKGAHQVVRAAALLRRDFPDIKIRIAGESIINNDTLAQKLRLSGYGKFLLKIINNSNLRDNVTFLGWLDEKQMIAEYQNAHVFVCPSSIENSPNSLGEAQLIGAPCVAAFVGGIPDMIDHGQSGLLYGFEEVEMLAENLRKIFTDDELSRRLSLAGINAAGKRHNRTQNLNCLIKIYDSLM